MNRCTSEVLESYLCDYGWTFSREGDGLWKTNFSTDDLTFPLSIIMTDNVVSFIIQPFVELSVDWESWPEISRLLLELNARTSLAKFSLSEEGRIELSLDVLNAGFTFDSFTLTMGLLGYYAESHYDEILRGLDLVGYSYVESRTLLT